MRIYCYFGSKARLYSIPIAVIYFDYFKGERLMASRMLIIYWAWAG